MTRIRLRQPLVILLFGLSLVAGCSHDPEQVPGSPPPTQADAPRTPTAGAAPRAAKLRVTLLPAAPGTADELLATVAGTQGPIAYRWAVNGLPVDDAGGDRLGHGHFAKHDRVTVTVSSAGAEATAEVEVRNTPPRVLSVGYRPPVVRHGETLTAVPQVEDADQDPVDLRYRWFVNDEERALVTGEELAGDQSVKGDRISLEIIPADPEESGPAYRTGQVEVADAPPRFVSSPPASFRSATYIYQARAEDADGDPLTYRLESGPEGMTIDSRTGEVRWPVNPQQAGPGVVRISVSDDSGQKDVQEYRLEIQVRK